MFWSKIKLYVERGIWEKGSAGATNYERRDKPQVLPQGTSPELSAEMSLPGTSLNLVSSLCHIAFGSFTNGLSHLLCFPELCFCIGLWKEVLMPFAVWILDLDPVAF